jgi:hypothetical protein
MNPATLAAVVSVLLFLGMLGCLEAGYRIGCRAYRKTATSHEGIGTIGAAVSHYSGCFSDSLFPTGSPILTIAAN